MGNRVRQSKIYWMSILWSTGWWSGGPSRERVEPITHLFHDSLMNSRDESAWAFHPFLSHMDRKATGVRGEGTPSNSLLLCWSIANVFRHVVDFAFWITSSKEIEKSIDRSAIWWRFLGSASSGLTLLQLSENQKSTNAKCALKIPLCDFFTKIGILKYRNQLFLNSNFNL